MQQSLFKQEISWFIKPTDKVDLAATKLNFSDNFMSTFPTLCKLLTQASVLDVTLTKEDNVSYYKLFSWTNHDDLRSGWLCKFETSKIGTEILSEHQLLLNNMGGLQESYKQVEVEKEMLTDNQNFVFLKSECKKSLRYWTEFYDEICESYNVKQIDTKDLLCFVGEVNGNETFYHLKTKKVLLFAPDHNFSYVEALEGQPEYTFYTINGVTTFIDYAELLAQQWLDNVVAADN